MKRLAGCALTLIQEVAKQGLEMTGGVQSMSDSSKMF